MQPVVILATPLSGAVSGVEYVTQATLDSPLAEWWDIRHLDTATVRRNAQRGIATPRGCWLMARMMVRMNNLCETWHPQAAIIQCARNRLGFLKFALLAAAARIHHVPVIARLGGGDFDRFYRALSGASRRFVRGWLNRCAAVLVEADCLRAQFAGLVPAERVRWAHLGIRPPESWRKRPILNARRVLYVGHVSRAKGAVDLLEAMAIVQRTDPRARLTMLGEHVRRERNILHVQDPHGAWRCAKAACRTHINLPGVTVGAPKDRAFRRADLFVFPSLSEGFPVAVLEAMAYGLPILCTPVGALPEVLEDGKTAMFVPASRPDVLADRILEFLGRVRWPDRLWLGNHARRLVEERFTLTHYAEGMRRALGDIVECSA